MPAVGSGVAALRGWVGATPATEVTPATKLTLKLMRKRCYLCEVVERWIPMKKIRKDLFGIGDVLCVGDRDVVLVQTTSSTNLSSRVRKIESLHLNKKKPELGRTLDAVRKGGIRIVVHGWKKAKGRWCVREVDVS